MPIGTPKKITLDLYINKHVYTRVAQWDENSREIIIRITDQGKVFPIDSSQFSVKVEYLKSDRSSVIYDIPSENILPDGTIKFVLTDQMCASYGQNEARLFLLDIKNQEILHTMHFNIIVDKEVLNNNHVTSSNEYQSFQKGLLKLEVDISKLENILGKLIPITKSQIDELF
jgi:hypothetical protein